MLSARSPLVLSPATGWSVTVVPSCAVTLNCPRTFDAIAISLWRRLAAWVCRLIPTAGLVNRTKCCAAIVAGGSRCMLAAARTPLPAHEGRRLALALRLLHRRACGDRALYVGRRPVRR